MEDDRLVSIIGGVLFVVLLGVSIFLKYDCCREQGYTHEECIYDIACNS